MVVYASSPLSEGGVEPPNAKLATFHKMRLPVALELLELLATVNIPQADRLVIRPTDELRWIRRVEMDATDPTAAIVSNVSFTGNCCTLSPAERGRGDRHGLSHALCNNTRTKKHDTRKDMGIITDGQLAFGTRGRSQRSTLRPHSLRHERV